MQSLSRLVKIKSLSTMLPYISLVFLLLTTTALVMVDANTNSPWQNYQQQRQNSYQQNGNGYGPWLGVYGYKGYVPDIIWPPTESYPECPTNNMTTHRIVPPTFQICTKPVKTYDFYSHPFTTKLTCHVTKSPCGCNPDLCSHISALGGYGYANSKYAYDSYDGTCASCVHCMCHKVQGLLFGEPYSGSDCVALTPLTHGPPLWAECLKRCQTGCDGSYAIFQKELPAFCYDVEKEISYAKTHEPYRGPYASMCKDTRGVKNVFDYRNCVCSVQGTLYHRY